jgi:hypothetical protein
VDGAFCKDQKALPKTYESFMCVEGSLSNVYLLHLDLVIP